MIGAKKVVVGHDARETSVPFSKAIMKGLISRGVTVLDIGLGTEEMYWATNHYSACGGISVTASHNPINFNGVKFVKANSQPLDPQTDMKQLKKIIAEKKFGNRKAGRVLNYFDLSKAEFVKKVISFIDMSRIKPIRVLIDSGNGTAGPTLDLIEKHLKEKTKGVEFVKINNTPDSNFPNGIPNPMLDANRKYTSKLIAKENVDFGVAFDGDFDRCFFFDENGTFIPGEYIIGMFSEVFSKKEKQAKVVYEPRVVFNTLDAISSSGAIPVKSKTGHAFMKIP